MKLITTTDRKPKHDKDPRIYFGTFRCEFCLHQQELTGYRSIWFSHHGERLVPCPHCGKRSADGEGGG